MRPFTSLDKVPDEILQHLLYYIPPDDSLRSVQLLSRRFRRLIDEPLLWRHHCRTSFHHWHHRHAFPEKLQLKVADVEWKALFILRARTNALVAKLLDAIIATKHNRLKKMETICRLGYDAKDFLLSQCRVDESVDDHLARRYFSNSILDSIHRSIAIEEWHRLRLDRDLPDAQVAGVRLERALGGFDMFVLHDEAGDLDDISRILDSIAASFRSSYPDLDSWTTRQAALALNRWLRANRLTGLRNPDRDYRNLRNLLIGQALRHHDHDSIPIISSAIFCCLAARLGMTTQCCAFPSHVHAIVFAPEGKNLDGVLAGSRNEARDRMYLDPYGFDDEIPASGLHTLLAHFGWQASAEALLAPVSTQAIVLRTAQNVKATFGRVLELQDQAHSDLCRLMRGDSSLNLDAALYSSMWALLILKPPNTFEWEDRLVSFLRRFSSAWPEDSWLVEKYLLPLYENFASFGNGLARHPYRDAHDPWQYWRRAREHDTHLPQPSGRGLEPGQSVPFRVGQVFRHRRYGWIGVITGWSDRRARHQAPPHPWQPDQLVSADAPPASARPPDQFYFMCFPSTGSEPHVVAADNIELVHDAEEIRDDMFPLAGRFFKRFDRASCTFVSNIREQYPDD